MSPCPTHTVTRGASRTYRESSDALHSKKLWLQFQQDSRIVQKAEYSTSRFGRSTFSAPSQQPGRWNAKFRRAGRYRCTTVWTVRFSNPPADRPPRKRSRRSGASLAKRASEQLKYAACWTCSRRPSASWTNCWTRQWRQERKKAEMKKRTRTTKKDANVMGGKSSADSPAPAQRRLWLPHLRCSSACRAAGVQCLSGQSPRRKASTARECKTSVVLRLGDGSTAAASP